MYTFEDWLNEASEAATEAKKAGLVSAGFGRWKNKDGKVVARSQDGKLSWIGVRSGPNKEQNSKAYVEKLVNKHLTTLEKNGTVEEPGEELDFKVTKRGNNYIVMGMDGRSDRSSFTKDEIITFFKSMYKWKTKGN